MTVEQHDDDLSHSDIESWFHGENVQKNPKEKGSDTADQTISPERVHLNELLDKLSEKVSNKRKGGDSNE